MASLDSMTALCEAGDCVFGPTVASGCRGGFDFTLFFEQAFFSIAPDAIFLVLFLFRVGRLYRVAPTARPDWACFAKLSAAAAFAALQTACLVFWSTASAELRPSTAVPAAALALIAALAVAPLSYYEHTHSLRPSIVLGAFLSLTALFDAVNVRTLWLRDNYRQLAFVATAGLAVKACLLFLEAQPKTHHLTADKTRSLEAVSGPYSLGFYWWLNRLFLQGFRKNLTLNDLTTLEDEFSSDLLERRMSDAWNNTNQKRRRALIFAVCSTLRFPLLLPVPARLIFMAFNYAQPFLIMTATTYVQSPATDSDKNVGYGLIGAAALIYLGIGISRGQYNYHLYRSITKVRGCLVGLIYHKTLKSTASATKASAALTLMSADVDRIALTAEKVNEMWAGTVEIAIAIWLLERQIGWASIAPLIVAAISFAGNTKIAKMVPSRLKQWNKGTQDRVSLTATVLRNMRSIKATGMTPSVFGTVQDARTHELDRSAHFRQLIAFMNLFGAVPKLLSAPLAFTLFVFSAAFFTEGGLSASRVFTTLSLLELLTTPLGTVLQSIPQVTASLGCFDRIQDYLLLDDHEATLSGISPAPSSTSSSARISPWSEKEKNDVIESVQERCSIAVELTNVSLRHSAGDKDVVRGLSLQVAAGELVMVIGPAGCGKTTLLRAVAGELRPAGGTLARRHAQIAYCQQTPWVSNATVRDNIVGQSPDDEAWYQRVRALCALDNTNSLEILPDGDEVIGSGGITLSGGQKQRLALARAVYARKPIVVLDDVLSALDAGTERAIFQALIAPGGLLRQGDTTVLMVTSSAHHLAAADVIVSMNGDGTATQYRSVAEIGDVASKIGSTPSIAAAEGQKAKPVADRVPRVGRRLAGQTSRTQAPAKDREKARKTRDMQSYVTYIRSMGWARAGLFLLISASFAVISKIPQVWVTNFTDSATINRGLFIGIYIFFAVSAAVLSLISFWWMMIIIIPISGSNLHKMLLTAVFGAPLSFFTSTDVGVILNRFSQDMNYATAYLPISTMNSVTTVLVCITQFGLIASGSGYLAIALPLLAFAVYLLQKFYLATSRQLRFLELEHKSPLYTALTETVEGLSTIRAFGWSAAYQTKFLRRLDDSQRPVYMLYCIQRWLNLVLDLVVAALAVLLLAFATQLRSTTSGTALGLALLNILGFGQSLSQFVFFYTELETSLGAIARIREYVSEITPEDEPAPSPESIPASDVWPVRGDITFDNISASYGGEDEPLVLENVSLHIPAGKIVGLAGRTGSGKSSLTLALLRLLDLRSGKITVDGIDIATVPRQTIRGRITTVPQDTFFPPTHSLRQTLAGTTAARLSDAQLLAALHQAGLLKHAATQLIKDGNDQPAADKPTTIDTLGSEAACRILDAPISALPLSAGQRQLFCLARALLRDNKIVILDECTSAVDAATEEKLRAMLRAELQGKTVLMVAHRAAMLDMCDVVVEIDAGRVVGAVNKDQH